MKTKEAQVPWNDIDVDSCKEERRRAARRNKRADGSVWVREWVFLNAPTGPGQAPFPEGAEKERGEARSAGERGEVSGSWLRIHGVLYQNWLPFVNSYFRLLHGHSNGGRGFE